MLHDSFGRYCAALRRRSFKTRKGLIRNWLKYAIVFLPSGSHSGKSPQSLRAGYHRCLRRTSAPLCKLEAGKFAARLRPVVNYAWIKKTSLDGRGRQHSLAANRFNTKRWRHSLTLSGSQSPWPQFGCGDSAGPGLGEIRGTARGWKRLQCSVSWPFYSQSFPLPMTYIQKLWLWMLLQGNETHA